MITRARLGPKLGANQGWQLVLADLALILFLVTLTALVNTSDDSGKATNKGTGSAPAAPAHDPSSPIASSHIASSHIASSQALFRPTARGPSLIQWLAEQPADPRAALTIIAQHSGEDEQLMWDSAKEMAQGVEQSGVFVRVIITKGEQSELYASLAYDDPNAAR